MITITTSLCDEDNSVKTKAYNNDDDKTSAFTDGTKSDCESEKKTCARKCCPFGQGYVLEERKCVPTPVGFNPPIWDENKLLKGNNAMKDMHFLIGKMNCSAELGEIRIPLEPAIDTYHFRKVRRNISYQFLKTYFLITSPFSGVPLIYNLTNRRSQFSLGVGYSSFKELRLK